MIKEKMKVGPKGQVVIPKVFRKAFGLHPGSIVIFESDGNRLVIEKPETNTDEIFENIAKSGKTVKIHPHDAYEEQMEKRWKRARGRK